MTANETLSERYQGCNQGRYIEGSEVQVLEGAFLDADWVGLVEMNYLSHYYYYYWMIITKCKY